MLLIIAHHYVVNSGLFETLKEAPLTASSLAMILFGGWGKTGINCFVLITGYFMCKSSFTWQKLLKLYLQITVYKVVIYAIFCFFGHEAFTLPTLIKKLTPLYYIATNFTGCFLLFFMFIPFLNILLKNINRRQHLYLILLLIMIYTILPTASITVYFNYVTWFITLYIIAAYMRFYQDFIRITHNQWGILAIFSVLASSASVIALFSLHRIGSTSTFAPYYFISDSNKILALITSITSFMWFKDFHIPYSRLINAIGATTFGVFLIHANSNTIRQWLWRETVDCIGHFNATLAETMGYAIVSVLIIFLVCSGIDWFRGRLIEPYLMKSCDKIILYLKNKSIKTQKETI